MKIMKKNKILVVGLIGLLMVGGLVLAGCKDDAGGCKGDGACYYVVRNGDYKWCGDESCAVWKSTDKGQNSLSCNC